MKIKESESLELKKSTSEMKEAIISIVSILNKHKRGELYFGISNDGKVIGQKLKEKTLRDVSKSIADNIEPKIYPRISLVKEDNKSCIKIQFQGENTPYFAFGRAYMRVSDEDRMLSCKELERLIVTKNAGLIHWDSEACAAASMKDIDKKKLKCFLTQAGLEHSSSEKSLQKLGLLKGMRLFNSAVVLFGKSPEKFFPNCRLRCAIFCTEDSSSIIDRQEYDGDLFYLVKKAEEYLTKNLHMGMRVNGLYRIDVLEIDKEALREAILNAFCHRDYYEYDSVCIAIFKDRVEIRNPGTLYGGLSIEQIRKEMVSERRNEVIAEMFHRINLIEKWGRGIRFILMKEPATEFKEVGRHFIAIFKRKYFDDKAVIDEDLESLAERLTENQKMILQLISKDSDISKARIADRMGVGLGSVDKNVKLLTKKGLLVHIGPAKGGYWEIKTKKNRM